jgi:hypothetical protein
MQTPVRYELEDLGVVFPGVAGPRCSAAGPYRLSCSFPVSSVALELGDRDDSVSFAFPGPATVDGGDGDDRIEGTSGADTLSGGAGTDTVDYSLRSRPLQVDLDGVADDGEAGEGDNVNGDIEEVTGGAGDDRIVGSAVRNRLRGGSGGDQLEGAGARDALEGGAGADTLLARDGGPDRVLCGDGTDTAFVDSVDTVGSDCERVVRASVGIVGPHLLPVGPKGGVAVRIRCVAPIDELCRGRLAITMTVWRRIPHRHAGEHAAAARHRRRRTNVRLAGGRFAIPRGETRPVLVRLNPAARRRLDRCGRLRTKVVAATADTAGRPATASRKVTLAETGGKRRHSGCG